MNSKIKQFVEDAEALRVDMSAAAEDADENVKEYLNRAVSGMSQVQTWLTRATDEDKSNTDASESEEEDPTVSEK